MTSNQHASYNKLLNAHTEEQAQPGYRGAPIRYKHTYELDSFHQTGPHSKVRVTYNMSKDRSQKTLKPDGCIIKSRVADLNVYWPRQAFDFRISVSTEMPGPSLRCFMRKLISVSRVSARRTQPLPLQRPRLLRAPDRPSRPHEGRGGPKPGTAPPRNRGRVRLGPGALGRGGKGDGRDAAAERVPRDDLGHAQYDSNVRGSGCWFGLR
jgi:hypothetical protein